MTPTVRLTSGARVETSFVALGCFRGSDPDAGRAQRQLATAIRRAIGQPGWKARDEQLRRAATGGARPIMVEVHGLGSRADLTARSLGRWIQRAVQSAEKQGHREMSLILPRHTHTVGRSSLRILTRLMLSGYRFERYKKTRESSRLRAIHLLPPEDEDKIYRHALGPARVVARAVALARDLGNTPPNEADPEWMANRSRELADDWGFDCTILGPDELADRGMAGVLSVGSGSAHAPRFVKLEWGEGDQVLSLVGKGVTFDTGGISIKPSTSMEEMKYDKCGACTVLGIARAAAELQLPMRFRAYLPFVENMPDGASYRPGDIVRCYNGKTVEILDTDAEGRMILADALAWAAEEKPDHLLEYSTLTGASVVALGHEAAALYCADDALAAELTRASLSSDERVWPMPLWPEFQKEMTGAQADLRNLGSRWGGANSAAAFLASFVGRTRRWAHLDIAGTAYRASRDTRTSGATGFGVALTIDWLLELTGRL